MAPKPRTATPAPRTRTVKSGDTKPPTSESQAMLTNALGQIEKTFGQGAIMKLTDHAAGISLSTAADAAGVCRRHDSSVANQR